MIDIYTRKDNSVKIIVDGDNGVSVKDCIEISRAIKSEVGQSHEDFAIEISSPGIGETLKFSRQYINNIGRELEIKLDDGSFLNGKLKNADKKSIELEILVNKSNKEAKKSSGILRESFNYGQIKQARVKLKY